MDLDKEFDAIVKEIHTIIDFKSCQEKAILCKVKDCPFKLEF